MSNIVFEDIPESPVAFFPTTSGGIGLLADTSYAISKRRGRINGVGAWVSGAGAWVTVVGDMDFETLVLEKSQTYTELMKKYSIGAGVSGWFSWLFSAEAKAESVDIKKTFHEISSSQTTRGKIHIDLKVTGLYPNVAVEAQAYVMALEVTDQSGSQFTFLAAGNPEKNTGAMDQNNKELPVSDNHSGIAYVS